MAVATRKPPPTQKKPVARFGRGKVHRPAARAARSSARQAALQKMILADMTAGKFDVGDFCKKYGIKRDHLSRMTSYAPRTIAAWATGRPIKGAAIQKITELKRLTTALEQLVAAESIGPWFQTPNQSFEGSTPAQLVERGESDRLWRMIHLLESGQPG